MLNNKIIGKKLRGWRKEMRLTKKSLGNLVGCKYGTISGYETGRYLISIPVLYRICKKYNISVDYLLGKIDDPKYLK